MTTRALIVKGRTIRELRAEYVEQFGLSRRQARNLNAYLISQLERCQSDEARKLIVRANAPQKTKN